MQRALSSTELKSVVYSYLDPAILHSKTFKKLHRHSKCVCKEGILPSTCVILSQELQDGVLTIDVIEGKLGEIVVEGNEHYSFNLSQVIFHALREKPSTMMI